MRNGDALLSRDASHSPTLRNPALASHHLPSARHAPPTGPYGSGVTTPAGSSASQSPPHRPGRLGRTGIVILTFLARNALRVEGCAYALVGKHPTDPYPPPVDPQVRDVVEQRQQPGIVSGLPRREDDRQRQPERIHRQMNLAGQSPPGPAEALPFDGEGLDPGRAAPFFRGPSSMLVSPDARGVHTDHQRDVVLQRPQPIVLDDHHGQDPVPPPVSRPHPQTLVRGLPRPVPFRQIPPRRPRAHLPQDRFNHLPVIAPPTTTPPGPHR